MSKTRKLKSAKPYLQHQKSKVKTIGQMTPEEFTECMNNVELVKSLGNLMRLNAEVTIDSIDGFKFAIDARDREIKYLKDRYNDAVRQIPVPQPKKSVWQKVKGYFSK